MKKIQAKEKSLKQILGEQPFSIDYYQRGYQWGQKHVTELVEDLTAVFLDHYDSQHERDGEEVIAYGNYFLGSIIVSESGKHRYIVDGQQRLTSLTLLLICLYHKATPKDREQISSMISSTVRGKESFKLDVDERKACMQDLFYGKDPVKTDDESVNNIIDRYSDIAKKLDDEFQGEDAEQCRQYFTDWLIDKVYLVEITTDSNEDAHAIFETMNDRGLSVTPAEMLKGYLLAKIKCEDLRKQATDDWKGISESLKTIGKEGDSDAIKAWFRSQYAITLRERVKGASPEDFDRISTEFHRWITEKIESKVNLPKLSSDADFCHFISHEMKFYADCYKSTNRAATNYTKGMEEIFYNGESEFTLQFPALLAPLMLSDDEATVRKKIKMVATYLDITLARRIWNKKTNRRSTMEYGIFLLVKEIRRQSPRELASTLCNKLSKQKESFDADFYMDGSNRPKVRSVLARMTDFVEMGVSSSDDPSSRYAEYVEKDHYDIEHIWANKYEGHEEDFPDDPAAFSHHRNRIGGLLLLPKKTNRSLGDKPYADKLKIYLRDGSVLAKSLHKDAYEQHPGFRQFMGRTDLPFKRHDEFKKADLEARQELYRQLAEKIWDPAKLQKIADE